MLERVKRVLDRLVRETLLFQFGDEIIARVAGDGGDPVPGEETVQPDDGIGVRFPRFVEAQRPALLLRVFGVVGVPLGGDRIMELRQGRGANLTRPDPGATVPFPQKNSREHQSERVLEEAQSRRS